MPFWARRASGQWPRGAKRKGPRGGGWHETGPVHCHGLGKGGCQADAPGLQAIALQRARAMGRGSHRRPRGRPLGRRGRLPPPPPPQQKSAAMEEGGRALGGGGLGPKSVCTKDGPTRFSQR